MVPLNHDEVLQSEMARDMRDLLNILRFCCGKDLVASIRGMKLLCMMRLYEVIIVPGKMHRMTMCDSVLTK